MKSNLFNDSFYLIDLQQGTTAWLKWRRSGIGASDAHVAMTSGFKVRQTLIKEKRGVLTRDYQSQAMEEGHQLEPGARALYIKTTGKKVIPACIQSSRYEWLIASLDGISEDHSTVVEIKCGAHAYKTIQESGEISRPYYSQVQHILAVTGLSSIDFWCYRPNKKALLLPIERDDEYIEELMEAELALWNELKSTIDKYLFSSIVAYLSAISCKKLIYNIFDIDGRSVALVVLEFSYHSLTYSL